MKNYLLSVFVLLITGCGHSTQPSVVKKDRIKETEQTDLDSAKMCQCFTTEQIVLDSVKICQYFALEQVPVCSSVQEIDFLNELLNCIKPDTIYRKSVDIDKELGALRTALPSCPTLDNLDVLFEHRLEYHLSNPLTFWNDLPQLSSASSRYASRDYIFYTPDRKFKFYCLCECFPGTADLHKTYLQYLDSFGNVKWMVFDDCMEDELGHWGGEIFDKAWQYTNRGTTYYVLHVLGCEEFEYCRTVLNREQLESAAKSSIPYSHYKTALNEYPVEYVYFDAIKDFININ